MHSTTLPVPRSSSTSSVGKANSTASVQRQGSSGALCAAHGRCGHTAFSRTLLVLLVFGGTMILLEAFGAVSIHFRVLGTNTPAEPLPRNMLPQHVLLQQVTAGRSLANSSNATAPDAAQSGQHQDASDDEVLASFMTAARQVLEARDFHLLHLLRGFTAMLAAGSLPSKATARAAFRSALDGFNLWGVFEAPPGLVRQARDDDFSLWLLQAFTYISATGTDRIVPCNHDPTLPPPSSTKRYAIASNLHNSAGIMQNFIVQLLRLVTDMPAGATYVSVYESGSTDATPMWLILLRMLLTCIRVPHTIKASGALVRQPGQERIEYLAAVRNELLAPFFVHEGSNSSRSGDFVPDQFVFINDVFFCPDDVTRLMLHDATMACGLDLGMTGSVFKQGAAERRRSLKAADVRLKELVRTAGEDSSRLHNQFFGIENVWFYDNWVAKDLIGHRFSNEAPFVSTGAGPKRVRAGLPTPVQCCWNGVARIDAAPFLAGMRFRTHLEGECMASECSLVCDDLWRMGPEALGGRPARILMDPSVRVSYGYIQKWLLNNPVFDLQGLKGIGTADWAATTKAAAAIDWAAEAPALEAVQCCDLLPGNDIVDSWDLRCHNVDIRTTNYTAKFLDSCHVSSSTPNKTATARTDNVNTLATGAGTFGNKTETLRTYVTRATENTTFTTACPAF